MLLFYILIIAVISYLLGSFNGALLVSKLLLKEDIREHGSSNAGLTNFHRTYGGSTTLLVFVIDVTKAVIAALIGGWILNKLGYMDEGKIIAGLFLLLGHMFPIYYGFKGGKGILSGGTIAFMMDIRVFVIVMGLFLILTIITRYVSLGSLAAAVSFPFSCLYFYNNKHVVVIISFIIGALITYMHRANIKRLISGTESKLTFHKK